MSAPYLNRGESIILTTHRVSAGSVVYDALLTNERLILMDSRYTRFEPRMIHFPAIISVKGGKVPTGEPAIILILDEPDKVSGSAQVDLIFTQQPGEQRKEERELWVRKIIELVVSARERVVQTPVPLRKKTGMHPTVRRWVAPEPARPHTSAEESASPPRRVIVTPDEEDLPAFNRADLPPEPEIPLSTGETAGAPEEASALLSPIKTAEVQQEEIVPSREAHAENIPPVPDEIPGAESASAPMDSGPDLLDMENPGTPAAVELAEEPGGAGELSASFAGTIRSALQSLQSQGEETGHPEMEIPAPVEHREHTPAETPVPKTSAAGLNEPTGGTEWAEEYRIPEKTGIYEEPPITDLPHEHGTGPGPAAGERAGEIPGIPLPDTTAPMGEPREPELPARQPDSTKSARPPVPERTVIATIAIVIIAMLVLFGGIVFLPHYVQDQKGNIPAAIVPTTVTITQTPVPVPPVTAPTGVRFEVIYPGMFTGSIGNPGFLHQVSGTGNHTYAVLMMTDIVQATIRKQDNSGDRLTVGIYNNGTLLAQRTVTAPMGEINLLIDTRTSNPPGMTPDSLPADSTTRPGNGTLVYY